MWAGALGVVIVAVGPWVWAAHLSSRLPPFLAAYLDNRSGLDLSRLPLRRLRARGNGGGSGARPTRAPGCGTAGPSPGALGLLAAGALLAPLLEGRVDYWSISPAYVLVRLGGLLLLLRAVEALVSFGMPGTEALALLGRETLLVFVLHLYLLFGGIAGTPPLARYVSRLGLGEAFVALGLMAVVLLAAAWLWRSAKQRAPHEASLALAFLSVAFLYEFVTRPW